MLNKEKVLFLFLLFFTLCSVTFLYPAVSDIEKISRYTTFLYAAVIVSIAPSVLYYFFQSNSGYVFMLPLKLLIVAILISIISSYMYWDQSLKDSVLSTVNPVAGYCLYFYLNKKKVSLAAVERVIFIMGVISVSAFLISFVIFPRQIFNNPYENEVFERGFQRIQLAGFGFIYLLFFMSLNKISVLPGRKMMWICLALMCYACIIMSLTRTYMAFSTLIAAFYLFRSSKPFFKTIMVLAVIGAAFLLPQLEFVKNMTETTKENLAESEDYIRIQGAKYFLSDFQRSGFTRFFGNGFSYGQSDYSDFIAKLKSTQYFFIEDLGLVGLYVYLGVLAIVAYVIIFFRGLKEKLQRELAYPKMFLVFILLIGFNSYATYSADFLLCLVFVFYLYEINRNNRELAVNSEDDNLE